MLRLLQLFERKKFLIRRGRLKKWNGCKNEGTSEETPLPLNLVQLEKTSMLSPTCPSPSSSRKLARFTCSKTFFSLSETRQAIGHREAESLSGISPEIKLELHFTIGQLFIKSRSF